MSKSFGIKGQTATYNVDPIQNPETKLFKRVAFFEKTHLKAILLGKIC